MIAPPPGLLGIEGLTAGAIAWMVAAVVGVFAASIALVVVLLVQMPATYFHGDDPHEGWRGRHPVLRWAVRIVKNLVGVLLVGVGILMLLTPGQGALTILLGVMLLDFPGKRRIVRELIGRPTVLQAVNRLRARFGKPPIVLE